MFLGTTGSQDDLIDNIYFLLDIEFYAFILMIFR